MKMRAISAGMVCSSIVLTVMMIMPEYGAWGEKKGVEHARTGPVTMERKSAALPDSIAKSILRNSYRILGLTARSAIPEISAPALNPFPNSGDIMPVFKPDPTIDYTILAFTPDTSIDYTIQVVRPSLVPNINVFSLPPKFSPPEKILPK